MSNCLTRTIVALVLAMVTGLSGGAAAEPDRPGRSSPACTPGARTLSAPGDVLFPEAGNGGYRSRHSIVRLRYDARTNRFLPGTRVVLVLRATQCLTEFSVDFEPSDPEHRSGSPRLRIDGIRVSGEPASSRMARPSYPGNPFGPDDPDPRAQQQSQQNPVGGPEDNPLPPACSPNLSESESAHARDGELCPATKLVITPSRPIPAGSTFRVRIDYHGRPGLHHGADSARDGWWRSPGGAVTNTEPLGTQAWMPLNNHPSAKPTYRVIVRTQSGKTVIAPGVRVGARRHRPDRDFPEGSTSTRYLSTDPVASYLVVLLVGDYRVHRFTRDQVSYRLLQDRRISPAGMRDNNRSLEQLDDSTRMLEQLSGPFPFPSNGAAVTLPAHTDMEMQNLSIFSEGGIDTSTLFHENMHQWWGDAVTQATFDMVWFKEGLATFAEDIRRARMAAARTGKRRTYRRTLQRKFDRLYHSRGTFWSQAPSAPTPATYFDYDATYLRPGALYLALYLDLGHRRFSAVLHRLQRRYGGRSLTRDQWERAWLATMPSSACRGQLRTLFEQWLDTAYPIGERPELTGLSGECG